MKRQYDPSLLICCLIWGIIHICRYLHRPIPILNDYLTDLIAVPAISCLTLSITRRFIVRNRKYQYPPVYYLFMALYVSVVFEGIMPLVSSKFTRDGWDVAAY